MKEKTSAKNIAAKGSFALAFSVGSVLFSAHAGGGFATGNQANTYYVGLGCPCVFDDGAFIFLRADRVSVYVACTGCFAECRADTACKFREIAGLVQAVVCLLPVSCVYKIIPFRNQVV